MIGSLSLPKIKIPTFLSRKRSKERFGVSMYITDKFLRFLVLNSNRKPLIDPVEIFWEGLGDKDKAKRIQDIVNNSGISLREVVTCITANDGILKFQRFPASMSKEDLRQAIDWYVKSETQQIAEETIYDYYILEDESDDQYVKVVITIARRSSVERLQSILSEAGLELKILDYDIVDIINYGLYAKIPVPFAILYIDYYDGMLVFYSKNAMLYNKIDFNYKQYLEERDQALLENFFIEVRNILVINDISNIYLAGPVIMDEMTLENIMMSLPVLGILDLEDVPPNFLIPYILAIRGLEE
jgi:type IV pilus assembly protein PilM